MAASGVESVRKIGELLVEASALRPEQIGLLLDEQRDTAQVGVRSRLGEIAVRKGWAEAEQVTRALRVQSQEVIERSDAGEMLVALGWISREDLRRSRERTARSGERIEEAVAELGLCSPERLRTATILASIRTAQAVRGVVWSTFAPFNIMELIVGEECGEAIRADGLCTCSQCWCNVFALALNSVPGRYVSENSMILEYYLRFRKDYGPLARERVKAALSQVRANPKASCWSRFSYEILAGRESEVRVHEVVVHVSARHVHLSPEHLQVLFGRGASLTRLKDLMQPGQFAANETVSVVGPKGTLEKVRVLGPVRGTTQVEISGTDQFVLGVQAPVRESGSLEGTPGVQLKGPAGQVTLEAGLIRALRHIHMLPADADRIGVHNGAHVSVRLVGDRTTIAENVLVRAVPNSALEMHIDTDEANAAGVPGTSNGQILIPMMTV